MCIMYMWAETQSIEHLKAKKRVGGGGCDGGGKKILIKQVTSVNLHFPVTVLIKNVRICYSCALFQEILMRQI